MPINYDTVSKKNLKILYTILFKGKNYIQCLSNSFNKIGLVKSEVVGGNLSILYSLLGSKSDICTDNKILLIEDLDEYLYHLDRMIISLKRAGKFNNLKALIVGSMTKIHDNKIKFGMNAKEIIKYHTEEFNYPICFDFPVGHQKNNKPLVLGKKSKLDITSNTVSLEQ
jgi:muramoyltetrapeptide carboxypeptidase